MNIAIKAPSLKQIRKLCAWAFIVSVFVLFPSGIFLTTTDSVSPELTTLIDNMQAENSSTESSLDKKQNTEPSTNASLSNTTIWVYIISFLTSVTSFIGFFSTTILTWRKDKREEKAAELAIKKQELELEKLRLELMKTGNKK